MCDVEYELQLMLDDEYQIVTYDYPDSDEQTVHFQGSITECDSWLRLKANNYL